MGFLSIQHPKWATGALLGRPMPTILTLRTPSTRRDLEGIAVIELYQEQEERPLRIFERNPAPILAHINVWTIGATIFELMTLHIVHRFLLKPRDNMITKEGIDTVKTNRKLSYGSELSKLIQAPSNPSSGTDQTLWSYAPGLVSSWHGSARGWKQRSHPRDERLYYAGNEIKGAKRGDWRPDERDRHSNESEGDLRDSDLSPREYRVMEEGGE